MYVCFNNTAIGRVGMVGSSTGKGVTKVIINDPDLEEFYVSNPERYVFGECPAIDFAFIEFDGYFAGELQTFNIDFDLIGTDFQKLVWYELMNIPYGETRTYKQIAQQIGHPLAARAVGTACNKNPLPIIIPCHRVVGSDGEMHGYNGGVAIKERLLSLEKSISSGEKQEKHVLQDSSILQRSIKDKLIELANSEYRAFTSGLMPNIENVLGVRIPQLRKLAKEVAKGDWREYLLRTTSYSFEENMLKGMIIGYSKTGINETLTFMKDFISKIDNWAVCDSFCTGLKFTKSNPKIVLKFVMPYLRSEKEYEVRFAVVMIMNYFLETKTVDLVLKLVGEIKHTGYYAKMAVAWALAECFVKSPEKTMQFFENNTLDNFTYNKALQKTIESIRVDKESKELLRSMKRKVTPRQRPPRSQ